MAVNYTDQVIQPRNTRISYTLTQAPDAPITICNKPVSLKIRPVPTTTSLSRLNSALFNPALDAAGNIASPSNLKGVWRERRRSFGVNTSPEIVALKKLATTSLLTFVFHNHPFHLEAAWAGIVSNGGMARSPPDQFLHPHFPSAPNVLTQRPVLPPIQIQKSNSSKAEGFSVASNGILKNHKLSLPANGRLNFSSTIKNVSSVFILCKLPISKITDVSTSTSSQQRKNIAETFEKTLRSRLN